MKSIYVAVAALMNLALCRCKNAQSHATPTYFYRVDKNGQSLDRNNPEFEKVFQYKFEDRPSSLDRRTSTLKVRPFTIQNAEEVEVSWYGINKPTKDDWIGLFCPIEDSSKNALDYFFVWETNKTTWQKGYGTKKVTLFNMRKNCEFRYFRVDIEEGTAKRVVTSNQVIFLGGTEEPLQGHIALTRNPTEMRIMWTSGNAAGTVVSYGNKKEPLDKKATGTSRTYKASDMCGPPANTTGFKEPGFIHDVLLKDLTPNTKYFYSFGSDESMSPVFNFTTAIPAGDKTPYKFIVYGDMGVDGFPEAKETAVRMLEEYKANNIRFVIHDGDISYARGYAYIWDQWHAIIQPYAVLVPYMVTIGNHEQDHEEGGAKDPSGASGNGFHPKWGGFGDDSHGECGVPMFNRFHMPDNGNHLWWYSFDYGLVHYIMMSTEHDYSPGSRQYTWLENDLKNVNRNMTPWVIISGHRAMYCSQQIHVDWIVSLNMQRLFEDLLYKYKVDLAFWAHYHSYERTCKVYRNICQDGGMVHIVVGTAGKSLDTDAYYGKDWSVRRIQDYGYGRVTVINEKSLRFEWIRNKDKALMDDFLLVK